MKLLAAPPKPLPANMMPFARPLFLLKYCDGTAATTYVLSVSLYVMPISELTTNARLQVAG